MNIRAKLFLSMLLVGSAVLQAKEAMLSMAYTNALDKDLPFAIFSKHSWNPDPKARFVKLHLHFDQPILVKGLEINSCGRKLDPLLSVFFNFDQWVLRLDTSLAGEIPEALRPKQKGDNLVLEGFEKVIEVRSMTINFEHNSDFRICGINLLDPDGKPYTIKTPTLAAGTVEASSILEPRNAYDPIYLFDSRFEYGWASDKKSRQVDLTFRFDEPRRIEKIRLWNGYQRSVTHCFSNSRAKKVRLTGDGGYRVEFQVQDILGSQLIALPKPFEGRLLKLEVLDAYPGKSYPDLVLSELRFFDGREWFMLDPTRELQANIASNRAAFAKAKTGSLLNESYQADKELPEEPFWISSKLRLRADGSFYLSGTIGEDEGFQYFALGNYEVKEADSTRGLKLRLFGLYHESEVYGDCNGCGRDCNRNDAQEDTDQPRIFQDFLRIKPTPRGRFQVVSESGGKKLKFKQLEYRQENEPK